MARLSTDSSSWRGQGLAKRYAVTDDDVVPRHRSRNKDTRRWCRGVVGREHTVAGRYIQTTRVRYGWWETLCTSCGMAGWRLPEAARAQIDAQLAKVRELEARWCRDGHLWDWEAVSWGREREVCAMCGRKRRYRTRTATRA